MSLHIEVFQDLRVGDLKSLQDTVQLKGGRLIAYSEVVSVLMISARSYRVKWVAAPVGRFFPGVLSSVITAFLGWWALFGPYRTMSALIWNWRGGFDVTDALLRAHPGNSSLLGYSETVALGAFQESADRVSRWICCAALSLLAVSFACLVWRGSSQ